jgi:hypothetical protein
MKKLFALLLVVVLAMCLVMPAAASAATTTYNARVYATVGSRVQVACQPGLLTVIVWTPVKVVGSAGYVDYVGLTATPKFAKCTSPKGAVRQIGITKMQLIGGKLFYVFDFKTIGIF